MYPVGSIYFSTTATNPGVNFGGTWVAIGAGQVLVGVDPNDTDFNAALKTGGSKTVAAAGSNSVPTFTGSFGSTSFVSGGTPAGTIAWPAGVPTHSGTTIADHASHTHTYTDVPNHVHIENINSAITGGLTGFPALADTSTSGVTATGLSTATNTGGVATGTTAGPSATLSHTVSSQGTIAWPAGVPTFSGSSLSAHSHTMTPAGTVTAPTFTGSPTSVVQPYLCVFIWQRTA